MAASPDAITSTLDPLLTRALKRIPVAIALLDEDRQVVFGQDRLMALAGAARTLPVGRRAPGDLVGCVNAIASDGGCGTSDACALCGANCAIARSRETSNVVTQECRIRYESTEGTGDLDLTVTAAPYESNGRRYTMLTVQDASDEKRRRALERVFFHDILNIAGGLAGLARVLKSTPDGTDLHEMLGVMESSTRLLLDEIEAQRELASAEAGELSVVPSEVESTALLEQVGNALRYHSVAERRTIAIAESSTTFTLRSDPVLLRRILVNLTKNALEASGAGGIVEIGATKDETALFWVHNDGVIPDDVQQQLFQRSFSTKGSGRGLGTYSVRLLAKRYLGGDVKFTSTVDAGTRFTVTIPDLNR